VQPRSYITFDVYNRAYICLWIICHTPSIILSISPSIQRCVFDVDTTPLHQHTVPSRRRRDGISTLYRRRSNVVCPLGRADIWDIYCKQWGNWTI